MVSSEVEVLGSLEVEPRLTGRRWLRWLLIAAGSLATGLGIAGFFLPLLPSTPFFLLAAACYGKSSKRAYRWLMTNRLFGKQLRYYRDHRGATRRSKAIAITTIALGIGSTLFFFSFPLPLQLLLIAIGLSVSLYLLRLRTIHTSSAHSLADEGVTPGAMPFDNM